MGVAMRPRETELLDLLAHRCSIVDTWQDANDRYDMLSSGERTVVDLLNRRGNVTPARLLMLDDEYRRACQAVIHERAARR